MMKTQFSEMRTCLVNCGYPERINSKTFNDAALQGPASYKYKKNSLFFITT